MGALLGPSPGYPAIASNGSLSQMTTVHPNRRGPHPKRLMFLLFVHVSLLLRARRMGLTRCRSLGRSLRWFDVPLPRW